MIACHYTEVSGHQSWYYIAAGETWVADYPADGPPRVMRVKQPLADLHDGNRAELSATIEAFQKATMQWVAQLPEVLRPGLAVAALCKCGCGRPALPKRDYATDQCRVTFCRKKKDMAPATVAAPTIAQPEYDCMETVVDLKWFSLKYHRATRSGFWYVTRHVEDGQNSATTNGFVNLNSFRQIADPLQVMDSCLEFLECIKDVDYRSQDYPAALWNTMQHFALYPNKGLFEADKQPFWYRDANERVKRASRLMPVTLGTVDQFVTTLSTPTAIQRREKAIPAPSPVTAPPLPAPAADKPEDMVGLLAKRILRAIKEGCEEDPDKLYKYCQRWGMWPGYKRDLKLAIKQLKAKEKIVDREVEKHGRFKAQEARKKDLVIAKLEQAILEAMGDPQHAERGDYKVNFFWRTKGYKLANDEYKRNWNAAFKRLQKAGKIVVFCGKGDLTQYKLAAKPMGLTARVEEFFKEGKHTPLEVAQALEVPKDKWTSVRSTVNILYIKGVLGRMKMADGIYQYARTEWLDANGYALEYQLSKDSKP